MVPVYYVAFTLASVTAGAVVYFEIDCMGVSQLGRFLAGVATTIFGVVCTAANKGGRGVRREIACLRRCCEASGRPRVSSPKLTDHDSAASRHVELFGATRARMDSSDSVADADAVVPRNGETDSGCV